MPVGRRVFLGGILSTLTALGIRPVLASSTRGVSLGDRLVAELNANSPEEVKFSLLKTSFVDHGNDQIRLHLRMTWPPGMRQRMILAHGATDQEQFENLLASAKSVFAPGFYA